MHSLAASAAVLVLVGTIVLVAWRPRGLREGFAAAIGAALMIALGWATLADAWQTARATAGIMLFLIGMMVVATVVAEAGFFDWAAGWAVRAARGRGKLLYVYLYIVVRFRLD